MASYSSDITFGIHLQELDDFLKELEKIQQSTDESDKIEASHSTIKGAMARLEDEFRYLLSTYTAPNPIDLDESASSVADSSFSSTPTHFRLSISTNFSADEVIDWDAQMEESASALLPELLNLPEIYYLRRIAEHMIAAGLTQVCVECYSRIRQQAMDANLRKLGMETLSAQQIQMLEPDVLANKIRRWIKAAQVCFSTLLAKEKQLTKYIFDGLFSNTAVDEFCFVQTVKGPVMQFFSSAEAVSQLSSLEKLFLLLDIYEALSELLPNIERMFEGKYLESIHAQGEAILSKLTDTARGILEDFEKSVIHDIGRVNSVIVPGGGIHLLTRYVMKNITLISTYKRIMNQLIVSQPSMSSRYLGDRNTPDMDLTEFLGKTPLAIHLIWIIEILQFNLDGKSKDYNDASLSHLFMMNNVHYIFRKINGSPELREIIGADYLKKLTGRFRLAATNYLRSTWARVLYCLRHDDLSSISSGVVLRTALRKRIKTFNAMFKEVNKTQGTRLVPDAQLREDLRISISLKLIPAYRTFRGRFCNHINENYIKYSAADLEVALMDFFGGYSVCQPLSQSQDSQPFALKSPLLFDI